MKPNIEEKLEELRREFLEAFAEDLRGTGLQRNAYILDKNAMEVFSWFSQKYISAYADGVREARNLAILSHIHIQQAIGQSPYHMKRDGQRNVVKVMREFMEAIEQLSKIPNKDI